MARKAAAEARDRGKLTFSAFMALKDVAEAKDRGKLTFSMSK